MLAVVDDGYFNHLGPAHNRDGDDAGVSAVSAGVRHCLLGDAQHRRGGRDRQPGQVTTIGHVQRRPVGRVGEERRQLVDIGVRIAGPQLVVAEDGDHASHLREGGGGRPMDGFESGAGAIWVPVKHGCGSLGLHGDS